MNSPVALLFHGRIAHFARISRRVLRTLAAVLVGTALMSHGAPASAQSTCLLKGPYLQGLPGDNIYLDTSAVYWSAKFIIPQGNQVFLDAQYPHSRYIGYRTYAGATNVSGLTDVNVAPAPDGSVNPFITGNARNLALRNYTAQIVTGNVPGGGGATNTLYSGTADGSVTLFYRSYIPDNGQGITGGVPLPELRVIDANNVTHTGAAACAIVQASNQLLTLPAKNLLTYTAFQAVAPVTNPGTWGYARIAAMAADAALQNTSLHATPDLSYIDTRFTRGFLLNPLNKVMKVTGRVPTTPATFNGESPMGTGQLRFWSLCMYEFATASVTDCLNDVTITTDANGFYTIAISRLADMPANANATCGKNWLRWSDFGAGAFDPAGSDGMLVLRNGLADPSFTQDIGDLVLPITVPSLPTAMGDYLPTVTYTSKAGFEGLGC